MINGALFAAIFTVIISSSIVLLTSVMDYTDLMIAAERAGTLVYLMTAFSIPIIASLVGLSVSLLGISFTAPANIAQFAALFNWTVVFLAVYSVFGFFGAMLIMLLLQYGTAVQESNAKE